MSDNPSVSTMNISEGQARYLEPSPVRWFAAEEQYHSQHLPPTLDPIFKYRDVASLWYSEMNRMKREIQKR